MSQHELTVCRIDLDRRVVLRDGQELPLTVLEARFLDYLIARPGEAIPTAELLVEVWQYKPGLESKAVKKTVLRLRKKIEEDPANPSHIIAVRGVGYRFEWPDADPRRTPQAPLDSEADRVLESLFRDTPLEFPITLGRFTLEERVKGLPHKMTFHASLQEASSGFAKELQVQVFDFRTLSSAANGPVQKFIEAINRWALLKHSNIIKAGSK